MKFLNFVFLFIALNSFAVDSTKIDLKQRWRFSDSISSNNNVIHFRLTQGDRGILKLSSKNRFSLFINRQLIMRDLRSLKLSVDSLNKVFVFPITLSIFCQKGINDVNTFLSVPSRDSVEDLVPKKNFRDFSVIVSLILIAIVTALLVTNRAVLFEYLNFVKLFSIRSSTDDSVLVQKVTSISNIFIYILCSFLIAFDLLILSQDKLLLDSSLQSLFYQLVVMILVIFGFLLIKILIFRISAYFFGLTDFAPAQYFNFVKLLFITFITVSLVLLIIFMTGTDLANWTSGLKIFIVGAVGFFITMTFLTLVNKEGSTVFHLFFYLCISEIFPVLILLKINYN